MATSTAPQALATGILTLSSTHPGTGQANASVDLPVARDPSTGMPILPATSLKGVARAAIAEGGDVRKDFVKRAFGPDLEDQESLVAGALNFGEGQLLVYPLRALHRPQVFATCPLLLRRWNRSRRAHGLPAWAEIDAAVDRAGLASEAGPGRHAATVRQRAGVTVLEDVALASGHVAACAEIGPLADRLGTLLPNEEAATRAEIKDTLVLLSDALLGVILRRAVPVQARIKLGPSKTTSEGGNLWYEEVLPADCLFGAVVSARTPSGAGDLGQWAGLHEEWRSVQIGGGETVGHGRCLWTLEGGSQP